MDVSANCVVVTGRRGGESGYAACMILATTRADVNGVVRRRLDARKASFARWTTRCADRHGVRRHHPDRLPVDWPVLVDAAVAELPFVIVGSGVRRSKLALPGRTLAGWPGAELVEGLGRGV